MAKMRSYTSRAFIPPCNLPQVVNQKAAGRQLSDQTL